MQYNAFLRQFVPCFNVYMYMYVIIYTHVVFTPNLVSVFFLQIKNVI